MHSNSKLGKGKPSKDVYEMQKGFPEEMEMSQHN